MTSGNNSGVDFPFAKRAIIRIVALLSVLFNVSMSSATESSTTEMQTIMIVTYPDWPDSIEIPISEDSKTVGFWDAIQVGEYLFFLDNHPVITFEKRLTGVKATDAPRDRYELSDGIISLVSAGDNGHFNLYATNGVKVLSLNLVSGGTDIDLSTLPPGIYVAKFNNMTFKIQKR